MRGEGACGVSWGWYVSRWELIDGGLGEEDIWENLMSLRCIFKCLSRKLLGHVESEYLQEIMHCGVDYLTSSISSP